MSLKHHPLISDWLAVREGRLIVRTGKVDIGQRISSALAWIAHEELTVPTDLIDIAPVRTGDSPDEGITSGSNSIEQSGRAVRLASATLRMLARGWAAEQAGGEPSDWDLRDGAMSGPGSNLELPLLPLIEGRDLASPVDEAADLRETGTTLPAAPMRGLSDLVTGRYRFLHDIQVPDMLHARLVRPPHARARLTGIDETVADRLCGEGIRIVRDGSFLAVAGEAEWPVIRAAQRLFNAADWNLHGGLPEIDIYADLRQDNAQRLPVVDGVPQDAEVPPPLENPDKSERYERPFTMHGALAPSAALAEWDGETLRITSQSQGIYPLRDSIAETFGLAPESVVIEHAPGSGCYGHNGADDAAFEAALIARSLPGTPVLLKWSRADEHGWEPFGTAMAVEIAARTGGDGRLAAISCEAIGGTFRGRPRQGPNRAGPARLVSNWLRADPEGPQLPAPNVNRQGGLQRNLDPAYAIPDTRYVKNLVADLPLRTSALRCLGAAANVFAIESFMDEAAFDAGQDPFDYRLAQLEDPRGTAVLERLRAECATLPEISAAGRGIAYAQYKNQMTRVGVAVEIDVGDQAEIRLLRATLVADAGRVVDRDGLEAQLEGGFLQGASWALCEEVTWDRDGVTSRDWESYPVLRFDNVPDIAVHLVERHEAPSVGAGEAASGPALAAIANALHDATGLRMRRLPLTADAISRAALTA